MWPQFRIELKRGMGEAHLGRCSVALPRYMTVHSKNSNRYLANAFWPDNVSPSVFLCISTVLFARIFILGTGDTQIGTLSI